MKPQMSVDPQDYLAFLAECPHVKEKDRGAALEAWLAARQPKRPAAERPEVERPEVETPDPPTNGLETWPSEWMYGITRSGSFFYIRSLRIGEDAARKALMAQYVQRIGGPRVCSEVDLRAALLDAGLNEGGRLREWESIGQCRAHGFIPPLETTVRRTWEELSHDYQSETAPVLPALSPSRLEFTPKPWSLARRDGESNNKEEVEALLGVEQSDDDE